MKEPRTLAEALDQIANLEEVIANMKAEAGRDSDEERLSRYKARWGLTGKESRLLDALYARRGACASRDAIMSAMYSDIDDEPEQKIIDVIVCKVRSKIGRELIKTEWASGYRLSTEALTEISALLTTQHDKIVPAQNHFPGKRSTGVHKAARAHLLAGPRTAREIASALGVHHSTVTACLGSMRRVGQTAKRGGNHVEGPIVWRLTEKGRQCAEAEATPAMRGHHPERLRASA